MNCKYISASIKYNHVKKSVQNNWSCRMAVSLLIIQWSHNMKTHSKHYLLKEVSSLAYKTCAQEPLHKNPAQVCQTVSILFLIDFVQDKSGSALVLPM